MCSVCSAEALKVGSICSVESLKAGSNMLSRGVENELDVHTISVKGGLEHAQ